MTIELCMGSSCFARGNAELLQQLETYLAGCEQMNVQLIGHLCMGECSNGPNVRIDGELMQQPDFAWIIALIEDDFSGEKQ